MSQSHLVLAFEISPAFPLYRKSGLFVLGLLEWVLTKTRRLNLFDFMSSRYPTPYLGYWAQ